MEKVTKKTKTQIKEADARLWLEACLNLANDQKRDTDEEIKKFVPIIKNLEEAKESLLNFILTFYDNGVELRINNEISIATNGKGEAIFTLTEEETPQPCIIKDGLKTIISYHSIFLSFLVSLKNKW